MSKPPRRSSDSALRRRAKARLERLPAVNLEAMSVDDVRQLIAELRLHQIELELRNEDLRGAQREREESRQAGMASEERERSRDELLPRARELLAEQRERRDLAEELQADIEQALALVEIKLAALQESHAHPDVQEIADDLSALSQRIAIFGFALCPTMLFDLGIVAAAQWLAEDLERRVGLTVHAPGGEEIEGVGEVARVVLFRTLRELLLDVAQHSGAEQARVRLWRDDSWVHLEVTSRGGDLGAEGGPRGVALLNAQQRIEQFGGRFELLSHDAEDGRILASLPLRIDIARFGEPAS